MENLETPKKLADFPDMEAVVICGYRGATTWTDNRYGACDACGAEIMWRPHSPDGDNVIHCCLECGLRLAMEAAHGGAETNYVITEKTAEELAEALGKGEQE